MPITVNTPDGPRNFPDGMSMDDISAVMKKQFPVTAPPPPKPTQFASAGPTGMIDYDALKALPGEFAGRTKQYAHEHLQAMRDRETKRNQPTLAGVLESMNPLSYAADVGNNLAVAASPFAAAGGMVGARIDPTYGKPGSGGNELQKYEDLGAALAPIPGPKMLAPAGRLIAKAAAPGARLAEGLAAAGGRAFAPVADVAFAGRRAKAAVSDIRSKALAKALEEAQAAKSTELRAGTKATTAQIRQQAAQAKAEDITPIGVGHVSHLSEIGGPGQQAAQANAAAAEQAKSAAFAAHTAAIDDVVKANEAKGNYINDLPQTKDLLKEVADQTTINPTASPTTAPRITTGQTKAYGMVKDALENRTITLSHSQAAEAEKNGIQVPNLGTEANPIYRRTFKTPLEAVTNLRRFFGDAAFGKADISGFEGVNASTFRDLYGKLGGIEDAYTAGLSAEQKAAYQTALANADKYSTGIGGKLTATEGQQEVAKMAASKVRNAVVGGGADAYNQFKAITDPVVARKFANDVVETALYDQVKGGPLSYEASVNAVKRGSNLGDMIHAIPELEATVQQHLSNLRDAESAGVQATGFGKKAVKSTAARDAARTRRLDYQVQFANLKDPKNKNILGDAKDLFKGLAKEGKITTQQYNQYVDQINTASKVDDIKKARNAILRAVATALGGYEVITLGGHALKMGQ